MNDTQRIAELELELAETLDALTAAQNELQATNGLSSYHPERNGYRRVGCPGRRSLWARLGAFRLELCAGREGDDGEVSLWVCPWQRRALRELISVAEVANDRNL